MNEPKHGGCFICGSTYENILYSKTIKAQSVALCTNHQHVTTLTKETTA